MAKPKVLAACPPSAIPTLDRILSAHVDLTFVNSLNAARDTLRTNADVAMVICGVHFDESRIYDLLEYARRERPEVPFLCIRILDAERARACRECVGLALKAAGAVDLIDFAALVIELGRTAAEQRLETEVLRHSRPARSEARKT